MNSTKAKNRITATLLAVAVAAALSSGPLAARGTAKTDHFFNPSCSTKIEFTGMDGPTTLLHITGTCWDGALGSLTLDANQRVTPSGPAYMGGVLLPVAVFNVGYYKTGSGEQLNATFTGGGVINLVTGDVDFSGQHRFLGGTGQFVNATGIASVSGEANQIEKTGYYYAYGYVGY